MDEIDPQIYQSAGGIDPGADGHTADHDAAAHHPIETPATPSAPVIAEISAPDPSVSAPDGSSAAPGAPEIVHLDHLELHIEGSTSAVFSAAQDSSNHEAVSAELHHGADESASADQDVSLAGATTITRAHDATVDHWVPVEDHTGIAVPDFVTEPFVTHVEGADAPDAAHAEVSADAGALSAGSSNNMRHGLMAAALAGTVSMNRDAKSRREKKGN